MDKELLLNAIANIQLNISTSEDESLIVKEFENRYRPHKIDNYIYDPDDLKSEYLIACWNAIPRAKLDVGDPIAFCVRRGKGAMLDYYRKVSTQRLVKICESCNTVVAYDRRNVYCKSCGEEYISLMKEDTVHEFVEIPDMGQNFEDTVVIDLVLENLIDYLVECSTICNRDRILAIKAIKDRIDFYTYAISQGLKSKQAKSLEERILSVIRDSYLFTK